ncbi:MAG TPA: ABC transporter permease [Pseudacidobacterium sp.]|jgi:predicted permease|nr:ABC transporter permease [Pseudacidobacterium sp.]
MKMRWFHKLVMQIQMLLRRGNAGAQLNDELQFHLDQQIAENIAAGMSDDDARHAAMRSFGNPATLRDQTRNSWSWNWLESLLRDIRISIRTLLRTPGFAVVAVLVMALGIGANVALFTVVRSVLLKPLPFKDPEKLVALYDHMDDGKTAYLFVAPGDFYDWQKQTHSFEQMAIWKWSGFNASGDRNELPEFADAGAGSWNLLSTLGISPVLGRSFVSDDDRPGARFTTILSWSFFKRRFNADPSTLGKTIRLNGKPYTIIGVLPEWFTYPDPKIQLWVPFQIDHPVDRLDSHGDHCCRVVARVKEGISTQQAIQEVGALQHQIRLQYGNQTTAASDVDFRPITDSLVSDVKKPLYVLLAAVGCLLLISCLNFSNLLVARTVARRREIAIRTALGSSRLQLCRVQIMESLLICIAGGIAGGALALMATRWLVTHWHGMPRADAVRLDGAVVLFAVGMIVLCGVLAGLVPAFSAMGESILFTLQESSRAAGGRAARAPLRKILLTVEVALTVVLLIGAGLLFKSFLHMRSTDLGCAIKNVLTIRYVLKSETYAKPEQVIAFHTKLLERVRHLPGAAAAGLTNEVPGGGYWGDNSFTIPEHPPLPPGQFITALFRTADPDYFSAIQIPLIRGRFFTEDERLDNGRFVIINQAFAREFFPNEDPLGKHIRMDWGSAPENHEVIGIVGDTLYSLKEKALPMMYFPILSSLGVTGNSGYTTLVVRSRSDASAVALPIQKVMALLDPDLPVTHVFTMEQIVGEDVSDSSFTATLVLAFAGLSLILAAVGLYGVLSYLVAQRTTEIGIRIAFGARREQVMRLMLMDGLRPALVGLVLGLAASAGLTRVIQSMLYGTSPLDAGIFVSVVVTILLVAAVACALPAWRASRLDPVQALRTE